MKESELMKKTSQLNKKSKIETNEKISDNSYARYSGSPIEVTCKGGRCNTNSKKF